MVQCFLFSDIFEMKIFCYSNNILLFRLSTDIYKHIHKYIVQYQSACIHVPEY